MKQRAISIGNRACLHSQGQYAIAIGTRAGQTNQHDYSIVIDASNTAFSTTATGALYIAPIRILPSSDGNVLMYTGTTNEIYASSTKSFIIDHPLDEDQYLVHGCLEGPESAVYYRGIGCIENNNSVEVSLPSYTKRLAYNFTAYVTPVFNGNERLLCVSDVDDGKFTVYGQNGMFTWIVIGTREEFDVEIPKNRTDVKGDGPYKYI